jgi:peptide/nickel transport system substrate-binding protein
MRNKVALWCAAVCAGITFSCSQGDTSTESGKKPGEITQLQGGRYRGGVFRLNEPEFIKSLFPPAIVDVYSYRVATQIYEGLFKFDQETLDVIEGLAESLEVDQTGTVYTIRLRKGVFFHDDACFPNGKGREFDANDVKYCITRLCTQPTGTQNGNGFHIMDGVLKGARKYYDATANGQTPSFELEGFQMIDKHTVRLVLERPNSQFKINLARPEAFIFPREYEQKYGANEIGRKAVGTGPFILASIDENKSINLKRNPNYYRKDQFGNALPYLDGINVQFIEEKRTEFLEFKAGRLDMAYRIPTDYIIEILQETEAEADGNLGKYPLQREPEAQTQIYAFQNMHPVFKDRNVRKAISFAIDRKKILDYVLNGEGYEPGFHGLTPPAFKWYDIHKIPGYDLNKDSAQYYLAKAGYPLGKGFPKITLEINEEGGRQTSVAAEVQRQLKEVLNIDLAFNTLPHSEISTKALNGDFAMLRLSWLADFPSPENFLWMFHSKYVGKDGTGNTYPNITRYVNPSFDQLYEKALTATSTEEATKYFLEAEKVVMNDAPILVLWYDERYRLLQKNVKNLPNNPMQYRDFTEVYLEPVATKGTSQQP